MFGDSVLFMLWYTSSVLFAFSIPHNCVSPIDVILQHITHLQSDVLWKCYSTPMALRNVITPYKMLIPLVINIGLHCTCIYIDPGCFIRHVFVE
jgi:hypothetical protein